MKRPVVICLSIGVCLAAAQESGSRQFTMGMTGTASAHDLIAGKPYSAKVVNRNVQTLPDGTHITGTSVALEYRDTMGRTRLDRQVPSMEDLGFIVVEIDDPVAGYHYTLDALDKVVYRIEMTQSVPGLPRPMPDTTCPPRGKLPAKGEVMGAEVENEEIGERVIEGLAVEGTRMTTTTPVGLIDNDKPLTNVQELWFSTSICGVVLLRSSSPQGDESTHELTNVTTTEPASSLFQVPRDYKIVDKAGRFEIRLTAPAKP